jgi:hypothetical protein
MRLLANRPLWNSDSLYSRDYAVRCMLLKESESRLKKCGVPILGVGVRVYGDVTESCTEERIAQVSRRVSLSIAWVQRRARPMHEAREPGHYPFINTSGGCSTAFAFFEPQGDFLCPVANKSYTGQNFAGAPRS